jgi:hypothetical protein
MMRLPDRKPSNRWRNSGYVDLWEIAGCHIRAVFDWIHRITG